MQAQPDKRRLTGDDGEAQAGGGDRNAIVHFGDVDCWRSWSRPRILWHVHFVLTTLHTGFWLKELPVHREVVLRIGMDSACLDFAKTQIVPLRIWSLLVN
jgi:hypothetical protein